MFHKNKLKTEIGGDCFKSERFLIIIPAVATNNEQLTIFNVQLDAIVHCTLSIDNLLIPVFLEPGCNFLPIITLYDDLTILN